MEEQKKEEHSWLLAKYIRPIAWVVLFLALGLLVYIVVYAKKAGMMGGHMKGGCGCTIGSH